MLPPPQRLRVRVCAQIEPSAMVVPTAHELRMLFSAQKEAQRLCQLARSRDADGRFGAQDTHPFLNLARGGGGVLIPPGIRREGYEF